MQLYSVEMDASLVDLVRGEILFELAQRGEGDRVIARVWGVTTGLAARKLEGREEITTDDIDRAARWFGVDPFEFVARAERNGDAGG
jgi:plasmid maintenance system antidote protein VapI